MTTLAFAKLTATQQMVLAVVGTAAVVAPFLVGMLSAPVVLAQAAPFTFATQQRFEVVSIKRTSKCSSLGDTPSPGRFHTCGALAYMIQGSYDLYTKEHGFTPGVVLTSWIVNIQGAPSWLNSEMYEIEGKTDGKTPYIVMAGPMLQAVLEDRLKLKVHWQTRQVPVYELTLAKGGQKLEPVKDENCVRRDPTKPPAEPPAAGDTPPRSCEDFKIGKGTLDFSGFSVSDFAQYLGRNIVTRPVIDKTGLAGHFIFHLQFAFDEATPMLRRYADSDVIGPSVFTAIQEQLGLRLEPGTGPHDFLVIDSVERPTEN